MDNFKVKNRIIKLREEISRLRTEYHVKNNPKVTDDVYESLTRELHDLENKYPEFTNLNSSVNRVAGKPLPEFKKVKHDIRMLSLNDVFEEKEIIDWENRLKKIIEKKDDFNYFCEVKLDGLSASLHYEDGVFIRGATRGDGWIGEDITENLKMINSIPLKLNGNIKGNVEIRGEVVMTKKTWEKLNKKQEELGKPTFANTRNAAAGSLRQLDPGVVKDRGLSFFAWDIASYPTSIKNHSDKHKILKEMGFTVAPYEKEAKDLMEVFSFIKEVGKLRASLPYGTDGMVVSVDDLEIQESLGVVGKAPRYMVAYKYEAERATTIVTNITVNVGSTGVMTPLAHFNPTLVAGSTISKATLHNMDQIERLDIRVGDTVVIQKAGDVIPEVVEVLSNMRTGKEKKFKMPQHCPVCNYKIERKAGAGESSVAFYCTNKNCPARSRRGIQHFVNIYEIYEIGPKILDRLKDEGLISDAADLFTLEVADLSGLQRFGVKSAENIINSIESHRKILLWRFIYALGIIHIGEQTAQDLANHFGSLEKISKAKEEEINSIPNIGPVVSRSIYEYFQQKENLAFLDKLFENGVVIDNTILKSTNRLKDKIFVLTGTLPTLSREDAKKMIIKEGGRVSGSVSSKTDYVLAGEEAGSKLKDAEKLGVKIIGEKEFLKMI
ncbi:NAD-dependent DNA ligase LigA [Candidatus Nomurabacteria bacterium]|nr:NAD-dependent DNA ligase LigA [Candidatus Nomurabacteria bacterium]